MCTGAAPQTDKHFVYVGQIDGETNQTTRWMCDFTAFNSTRRLRKEVVSLLPLFS